jgi:hypothetical protein
LRIIWEPYIDELLVVVDDIEERKVDDCMTSQRQKNSNISVVSNERPLIYMYVYAYDYNYRESMSCVNEH